MPHATLRKSLRRKNADLHGSAPDKSEVALILVDVINDLEHCRKGKSRSLIEKLYPERDDYFVLKPKHSGFFSSALETLLRYLRVRRLIITGIAGNFCVLFTANDAYMRDYELAIPSDCVISNTAKENTEALQLMKRYLKADTRRSQRIIFGKRERLR